MRGIEPHAEGAVLVVRAQPGASRDQLRGTEQGLLKVCVTQAPEKGKANQAIAALLAKKLGLRRSQVELLSGTTARQKRFLVRGVLAAELEARLRKALPADDQPGG